MSSREPTSNATEHAQKDESNPGQQEQSIEFVVLDKETVKNLEPPAADAKAVRGGYGCGCTHGV